MSHVDEGALHAYLDGELPAAERAALEAHVAACSACGARLADERALVERASQLLGLAQPAERPAPPLHQLRQRRVMWRLRMPLAWAASIVLALSMGYYLRGPESRVIPQAAAPVATESEEQGAANQADRRADELTRGTPARVSANSTEHFVAPTPAPAAGVVAIEPPAVLRDAASVTAVVPSARVAVEPRAEADLSSARGRLVATEWPIIRREPARQILGTDPVGVPGLAVRGIRRSPLGDGTVLVEQQLDSTTVIQLYQRPALAERNGFAAPAPQAYRARDSYSAVNRLARFVGRLRVEIAGPLSQDSLNRLLEQVKPIP